MKSFFLRGKEEIIYEKQDLKEFCNENFGYVLSRSKHKSGYMNEFLTFDIETSTIIPPGFLEDMKKCLERPKAYMYVAQMCLGEKVIMLRTWDDVIKSMNYISDHYCLSSEKRMVVYVHMLSYELQFLKSFFKIEELFAKDIRKPLKFVWKNFEFRCSYFLTNMSLEKFCENSKKCTHPKLSGEDFDYSIMRTPQTELNEDELGYIFCDVKGLHECIEELMETENDNLSTIPMTSTGYVRRDCRRAVLKNKKNYFEWQKSKLNPQMYKLCRDIFRGGDTHASRFYSGMTLRDVGSRDLTSAYPFAMMTEYFPCGKMMNWNFALGGKEEFKYLLRNYCVMFRVQLYNLRLKKERCDPYLDIGHATKRCKIRGDNGRIIKAEMIEYAMTEIDWNIVNGLYDFDDFVVLECYYCKRGKISKEIQNVIWFYFGKKCELAGIEEKKYEYGRSKNKLNAIYGMFVSSIVHDEIILVNGEWKIEKNENIEKALDDYYGNRNNFLSYQQGIYVTAHVRKILQILREIPGNDSVYWDTDSLKMVNYYKYKRIFEKHNRRIKSLGLVYKNSRGKKFYMGLFEDEGTYSEFKTFGAKKYAYIKDGEFTIVVAGMGKKKGIQAIKEKSKKEKISVMDCFELGQTYENVGRTVAFYDDRIDIHEIEIDGVKIITGSSVGIVETTYTLGITNEYYELLFEKNYGLKTRNQLETYESISYYPYVDLTEVWNYA